MTDVSDERVWLHHRESGGYFHCPVAAVEDYLGLGWQVADGPPVEHNPVTAELVAAQQAAAEATTAEKARATKSSRKGGTADTTSQEG